MEKGDWLAQRFEENRPHLRAVAYRMLGSAAEAEDAVQNAWFKLNRAETDDVKNLGGWLTTVVARVCLDMLRSRTSRREVALDNDRVSEPVADQATVANPEEQAILADAVGPALLVVLDSLSPAERLAFVLHDMFAMPYEQIAPIVDRTPQTAKKLASQARRRVQGATPSPGLPRQRRVVDAFLAAARGGDFDELLRLLDPDVVLRADAGETMRVIRGAAAVAGQAETFRRMATTCTIHPAVVNGGAGLVNTLDGTPFSVLAFTVTGDRITSIDILADRDRLTRLDLTAVLA